MKILIHPNPTLRKKSQCIKNEEILSSEFQDFIQKFGQTMLTEDGAGLAAPQVGVLKRFVAVNENGAGKAKIYINPEIIKKSFRKNIIEEGCLSIPNVFGKVKRPKNIKVKYQDRSGNWHKEKCNDYHSRVLQHEIDHLDGILFIDKLVK